MKVLAESVKGVSRSLYIGVSYAHPSSIGIQKDLPKISKESGFALRGHTEYFMWVVVLLHRIMLHVANG
jgi:hypothetical protein